VRTQRHILTVVLTLILIAVPLVSGSCQQTFRQTAVYTPKTATPYGAAGPALSGTLRIFHAGSLSVPMEQIAKAFTAYHPGVRIERESGGSRTVIRRVTELGKEADVVASADYHLIPQMMYPDFADWTIRFARNRMVIAYTEHSKYASEINGENWYEILLRPDVRFGHADPDADPCGYRTLMLWQLAEKYYQQPGLYEKLDEASPPENTRPKSVELLALLESGELDYAFQYQSVAVQHNFKYVSLPERIDLSNTDYADFYAQAVVTLTGKTPGTMVEVKGEPIVYGMTIPKNAPHPKLAQAFVAFLLGPEGRAIMKQNGQLPIVPVIVDGLDRLPDCLGVHAVSGCPSHLT